MNEPTYCITGVAQMPGIGRNKTVQFAIYDNSPPKIGEHYYSRQLDVGVYVTGVKKIGGN